MMEFFLRIDDYHDATPDVCRVLEWLLGNRYRLHVAVIPGLLTTRGALFLEAILGTYPRHVEVGQHGYIHTCRRQGRKRFEVGPGMDWYEQAKIIALGKQVLRERLPAPTVPVFTPPFNGYDNNTIQALSENRFEILSAEVQSQRDVIAAPLREVSINVDVCDKYFPRPVLQEVSAIGSMIRRTNARDGYVGIVLHPNLTILTDDWLQELFIEIRSIVGFHSVLLSQANTTVKG
jgi:hypothetical protein